MRIRNLLGTFETDCVVSGHAKMPSRENFDDAVGRFLNRYLAAGLKKSSTMRKTLYSNGSYSFRIFRSDGKDFGFGLTDDSILDIDVLVVDFSASPESGNFNKSMLSFRVVMMMNR